MVATSALQSLAVRSTKVFARVKLPLSLRGVRTPLLAPAVLRQQQRRSSGQPHADDKEQESRAAPGGVPTAEGTASTASPGAGGRVTANSFIGDASLAPQTGDASAVASGMTYLDEMVGVQAAAFESETDPRSRSSRALSLAQTILQVARQHHQQQDPLGAAQCYGRGIKLVEDALEFRAKDETPAGQRAVRFGTFMLSELFSGIGVALNDMGRREDALDAHKRALKIRKETVAKSHPSLAECYNNLGAVYYTTGNLQRAEEHYEQALELLLEASGGREEGPHIALTHYNIGTCRAGQGHKQAAVASLRRALKVADRALGPDHEHVEMIRMTLRQWGVPKVS